MQIKNLQFVKEMVASENLKVLEEVTEGLKKHTYFVKNGVKLYAFLQENEVNCCHVYKKPMNFSKRFRKFNDVTKHYRRICQDLGYPISQDFKRFQNG